MLECRVSDVRVRGMSNRTPLLLALLLPALAAAQEAPTAAPAAAAAPAAKVTAPPPEDAAVPVAQRTAAIEGPTGLHRVWSADPGPEGTFRLRFSLGLFSADDFPVDGATNDFTGTDFSLAYTPQENVEAFLSVRSTSNTNDAGEPELLQTQGDLALGLKGGLWVSDSVAIGAAASVRLLSGLGGGFSGEGTSAEFRALTTFDLTRTQTAPLRVHLDLSYYVENSEAVFADQPEEPSVVQEFGLQIARYDRFIIGLGLEAPVDPWVSPFLEYRIGTPFLVQLERMGAGSQEFAFASVPHSITPGIRAFPLPELALELAVRFGLSDAYFTGVPSEPPWMVVTSVAYTLDPRPRVIEREVKAEAPPPAAAEPKGVLVGRVVDAKSGAAIGDAEITYPGQRGVSAQLTDEQGRFAGYRFAPGKVRVQAAAEGYDSAKAEVTIAAGKDASVELKLEKLPEAKKGSVEVRVFDPRGKPMGASVEVGEVSGDATPDTPFRAEVPPGKYTVRIFTAGFADEEKEVEVEAERTASLRVPMKKGKSSAGTRAAKRAPTKRGRPSVAPVPSGGRGLATVSSRGISVARPIEFTDARGDTLTDASKRALDDLAIELNNNPQVRKVRVNAHTDARGVPDELMAVSERQARSVKSYLVSRGVDAERVQSKGYGAERPIAPNLTSRGRAKNRRVEFLVLEAD